MLKTGEKRIFYMFIIFFILSLGNQLLEGKEITIEATQVGIVIKPNSAIHFRPEEASEKIHPVELGEIFLVQDISSEGYPIWYRIILPSGRFGWISSDNFILQNINLINGQSKKDNYNLYDSLPDGKVIASRSKDETFFVLKYKITKDEGTIRQFYEVQVRYFKDYAWYSGQTGWVKADDVSLSYEILLLQAGRNLAKWWEDEYLGRYVRVGRDLDAAEKIFELLLEKYPEKEFINRADEYEIGKLHAGVVALESLARIDIEREDYTKAIQTLEQIIQRFPTVKSGIGVAGGVAKQESAEIYWKNFRDAHNAISIYQQIIKEYPSEEIRGFEWNTTLDISAIENISKIGEKENLSRNFMLEQYQMAIENSAFAIVKVIGYIERAKILRKEERFLEAIQELVTAIDRFPSTQMIFFKTSVHYTVSALDLLCQIYAEDLKNPHEARSICQKISEHNKDNDLKAAAMFLKAEILDYSIGKREQVIKEYETFSRNFGGVGWDVVSIIRGYEYEGYIGTWAAKTRLDEIYSFEPKMGKPKVTLFEIANFSANVVKQLSQGTEIIALYSKANQGQTWYKVSMDDGTIGWIEGSQVDFILKPFVSTLEPDLIVPKLMKALDDKSEQVVYIFLTVALDILVQIGQPAVPALIQALDGYEDKWVRRKAAFALGEMGEPAKDAVPALIKGLIKALRDKDELVRASVADALRKIGTLEAMKASELKAIDANVLGEIGKPAVPAMIEALSDEDEWLRHNVADALVKIGEPAVPALIEALKDERGNVRYSVALVLGNIGKPAKTAVPALIEALRDSEEWFRLTAADALKKIETPEAMEAVRAFEKNKQNN